ncbi:MULTISPECIES: hypothetical protein [Amycolatopsis]|uniref:Uncharacterized protein n=1 Tax=Amycolatopsis thailandensis TaxID=589330 RepID=A0A229S4B5_9PSEU|nr:MULTISPECIES: hypothetical protein [Amycolatopsis]OXM53792.1 hypothetical protein CFP71_21510 [Amycolatopsis thailandensis]
MNDEFMASETAWPGLWSSNLLHKVVKGNESRLSAQGRSFGLSECGVACVPFPTKRPGTAYCPTCFPKWPREVEPEFDEVLPPLPKRIPQQVPPRRPFRSDPDSPWFNSFEQADEVSPMRRREVVASVAIVPEHLFRRG